MNKIKMKAAYPFILMLLLLLSGLSAQSAQTSNPPDYDQLLEDLEQSILRGEKRALRDIATLLDKPEVKNKARRLLKNYTLFTPEEIKITNPLPKQDFLSFFYEKEEEIHYSHMTNSFYITSPEKRKIQYKIGPVQNEEEKDASIHLKELIQKVKVAVKAGDEKEAKKRLSQIGDLNIEEAYHFLFEFVMDKKLLSSELKNSTKVFESIANAVENYPDFSSVRMVLHLLKEQKISTDIAHKTLANLTNIRLTTEHPQQMENQYEHYMDSLSTMEEMRAYGYNKIFHFRPSFFLHSVNYYGKVLSLSEDYPWIQFNAISDLLSAQHPRALYFLTSQLYKNRKTTGKKARQQNKYLVRQIQKQTQVEIGVPAKDGEITFDRYAKSDRSAKLNYLIYWAAHHNDYEWDENRELYINKFEAIEKTQNYERLFRRLNSRNNEVALASFTELTEGEPSEIVALAEKYRQMFRTYNVTLPSFQFKYLEQLAMLTHYCRKNNIRYKLTSGTIKKLTVLKLAEKESDRYRLENEIIENLDLDDVTALEYWACLNEGDPKLSFSTGRILDWFYSKNWEQILNDETQLRLYLKKAQVFSNIGAIGTCNSYLNKFEITNPKIQKQLQNIEATETDKGIVSQLNQLVTQSQNGDEEYGVSINDFLDDPAGFKKRDIKVLPAPTAEDFTKIITTIQKEEDLKAIKYLLYFIRLHPNIEMVPHLFKLKKDDRVLIKKREMELTVADNLAPIMENIYNYSFPRDGKTKKFNVAPWIEKWEKDGDNYLTWVDQFFKQKLLSLKNSTTLNIDDINQITESVHFSPKYKKLCLEALQKVKPIKDIRRLHIDPKLSVKEDLVYFQALPFTYKALDDIPKLFVMDDPNAMLTFLEKAALEFDPTDRGSFYNNLFRADWFVNHLSSGKVSPKAAEDIKVILNRYFEESEYLSEFEEQAIQLNIAKLENAQKTLKEQLLASIKIKTDDISRMKIQQDIIARISYAEIPQVVLLLPDLNLDLKDHSHSFLSTDFGLPIFDLSSSNVRKELLQQHQELSEYDFYLFYLEKFGIDFQEKNDDLDYQKIYEILKYDIITPFVSSSGGKRDYYTYGVIKLLELKFNTRLGFHEKLNESQTFYSFSSSKRANAWMQYLEKEGLVKPDTTIPPSFNPIKAEH